MREVKQSYQGLKSSSNTIRIISDKEGFSVFHKEHMHPGSVSGFELVAVNNFYELYHT